MSALETLLTTQALAIAEGWTNDTLANYLEAYKEVESRLYKVPEERLALGRIKALVDEYHRGLVSAHELIEDIESVIERHGV